MTISTEKAFDMLPHAVDIIEKLDIKKYILDNQIKTKDEKLIKDKGFNMIMHILKNSAKVKKEVFQIVAIALEKNSDEVKKQPPGETISAFKKLMQDSELMSFFSNAM